jgi:hypothetical protein
VSDLNDRLFADAETRLGRTLTVEERAIDIARLDRDLREGKERLAAAIEKEKQRAIRARVAGRNPNVKVTPEIERILKHLRALGRAHAQAEMKRLGVEPTRDYAADPIRALLKAIKVLMKQMSIRISSEHRKVVADLGKGEKGKLSPSQATALDKLFKRVPGSRDIASRVVSGALYAGIGDVYERDAHLFGGWRQTAVMDGATCGPCRKGDGRTFKTWAAAMKVLPGGGPFPRCEGDGRCRCRLTPVRKVDTP